METILTHKRFPLIVLLVQGVLWCIVKSDPFFGDSIASTSKLANHIFDHNLQTVFYPPEGDPGHPTFYSYVLAVIWKIFGRSLWIAHLHSCIWSVLLVFTFRKVAAELLPSKEVNIATLLVLLFPTYLAQSAMMLNTVALMTFFLWGVYAVLTQQRWLILFAGVMMCITHLQSLFLLLSLAGFDLYRNVFLEKSATIVSWIKNRFLSYAAPVAIFTCWLWLHKQYTGWALVSPHYADIEEFNSVSEYIRAILLICWRLVDYGLLPFYLVLFTAFYLHKNARKEMTQWGFLFAPCCLAMAIFLSHTIGHRYFMAFGMLTILLTVKYLPYTKLKASYTYLFLGACLLAGNFLYYPGKTLGDATLVYRNYFTIEKQLQQEMGNTILYSHAPLANASKFTYLDDSGLTMERINETPFDSLPVILQSNVNAEFTREQIDYLTANWYGKSYSEGPVYVTLFYNPRLNPTYKVHEFRKPSAFEQWLINLKQKSK